VGDRQRQTGADRVTPAAELGGASRRLEGSAELEGVTIGFVAGIPIQQDADVERGVPVIRKRTDEVFDHDVLPDEPGLLLGFDPRSFVEDVDFAEFLEEHGSECAEAGGCDEPLEVAADSRTFRGIRNAVLGARPSFTWGYTP
jgi:hypothetical protein